MHRSYQLHIRLKKNTSLTVGKLGTFTFPTGWYIYTGSARRQIQNRVARHLSRKKKMRWHIDYLLAAPHANIIRVTLTHKEECCLNQETKGSILVPRFGSTDCRAGCGSHLKFSEREP
ncbi:MAG: GIY-YIG nuclease family protein [Acidobacteriota bacterium]